MSDQGIGALCLAAVVGGVWLLLHSFRKGESPTIWPATDSTRAGNPALFWFDISTYAFVLIVGLAVGLKALLT